jgi:hypothetical protein
MRTTDNITEEKRRVSEALARIDAEREKLGGQLAELETAERVLARYGRAARVRRKSSATKPATKPAAPAQSSGRRTTVAGSAGNRRSSPTLGDRVLALAIGKTQREIAAACKGARPNHVGIVIARHKRAGRIEERDGRLYAAQSADTARRAAL